MGLELRAGGEGPRGNAYHLPRRPPNRDSRAVLHLGGRVVAPAHEWSTAGPPPVACPGDPPPPKTGGAPEHPTPHRGLGLVGVGGEVVLGSLSFPGADSL